MLQNRPWGASAQAGGSPLPDVRLPEHSPEPGGRAAARLGSSGNRPQNKAPACRKALPNPARAAKKQLRDCCVAQQAPSGDSALGAQDTERCQESASSGEEEEEAALQPLSGTAGLCQQPHCFQRTRSSNLGLTMSHPCPICRLRGLGSSNGPSHEATWHAPRSLLGTPPHRPVAHTSGSNISYFFFFWSTRCSDQKFP